MILNLQTLTPKPSNQHRNVTQNIEISKKISGKFEYFKGTSNFFRFELNVSYVGSCPCI